MAGWLWHEAWAQWGRSCSVPFRRLADACEVTVRGAEILQIGEAAPLAGDRADGAKGAREVELQRGPAEAGAVVVKGLLLPRGFMGKEPQGRDTGSYGEIQ